MQNELQGNIVNPSEYHNYYLAGNITNSFAFGEIGSQDDFFLIGLEPSEEIVYPLLTGNIFDSEGNLLLQLKNNTITVNPGRCSKVLGDSVGYEIHDLEGVAILKVETSYIYLPQIDDHSWVTTIGGTFYDRAGNVVVRANLGDDDEVVTADVKTAVGINGNGVGINLGYTATELTLLSTIFQKKKMLKLITGLHDNVEIEFYGKLFIDATIQNSRITVSGGDFRRLGTNNLLNNKVVFYDQPLAIIELFFAIQNGQPRRGPELLR